MARSRVGKRSTEPPDYATLLPTQLVTSFKEDQRGLMPREQRGLMIPGTHNVGQVGLMSQWWKTK